METICFTRTLFLRGVCMVYLFAFISFYVQIPGLYGNDGILPARVQMQEVRSHSLSGKIHKKPTLLWFAPFLGLNTEYMMDGLSLIGIFLSFTGFASQKFAIAPIFGALWSLYYSLFTVGQTFMWFQWDTLLLEVGFLSILVAPWKFQFNSKPKQLVASPVDCVTFFLIKWLFFRFMFASGVVKLQSGCPTWWGLTALNVHFESQPLPTIFAWYMHHMPNWFLKSGTVFVHIVELIMPFFFFLPRNIKIIGFFVQVFFQISIILTGNYNFFNLLTIVLAFSLLDDQFFSTTKKSKNTFFKQMVAVGFNIFIHGFVIFICTVYYSMRFTPNWTIDFEVAFTKTDFDTFVRKAVSASIYVGGIQLLYYSILAISNSFKGAQMKISNIFVTLLFVSASFFLFGLSLVPHSALHKSSNSTMLSVRKVYHKFEHLQIVNSYGLFRRMTGIGGRPEIIIEGANDLKGPWLEYHFKYKPGHVNTSMPFVVPYQPRLDWQMWFAALGTYHQNPWILSTAYRILNGEKSVLQLLETKRLPFQKPPKYIKASLYHYHYSPWSQRKLPTWWKRENVGEYFPIFTKNQTWLVDYLKTMKILDTDPDIEADNKLVLPFMKTVFDALRNSIGLVDPVLLCWSVFTAYIVISSTSSAFSPNKKAFKMQKNTK